MVSEAKPGEGQSSPARARARAAPWTLWTPFPARPGRGPRPLHDAPPRSPSIGRRGRNSCGRSRRKEERRHFLGAFCAPARRAHASNLGGARTRWAPCSKAKLNTHRYAHFSQTPLLKKRMFNTSADADPRSISTLIRLPGTSEAHATNRGDERQNRCTIQVNAPKVRSVDLSCAHLSCRSVLSGPLGQSNTENNVCLESFRNAPN